jgi:RNase adaptor protein for sRNA GlmZ degradation
MSGVGKSTVIAELGRRGFSVVDTDEHHWLVPTSGHDSEWLWDETKIGSLLDQHIDAPLFVAGTRENQGAFYARFAHVVLLTAPLDVILDRVSSRHTNSFGHTERDREKITQDKELFEPLLRRRASLEIDTSDTPPDRIAERLIALL